MDDVQSPNIRPLNNFFQHAYVTNDFDRAKDYFLNFGISKFFEMRNLKAEVKPSRHCTISVALAYYGTLQIEIIQPEHGECDIYREILPANGFGLRLHHHGFLLYDPAEFEALQEAYLARGVGIVIEGTNPRSGNRYFYADTRAEMGHYMEHICLTEQGVQDYAKFPQNAL
jgi:hypothetical protein